MLSVVPERHLVEYHVSDYIFVIIDSWERKVLASDKLERDPKDFDVLEEATILQEEWKIVTSNHKQGRLLFTISHLT